MANSDRATAPAVVRAVHILAYLAEHSSAQRLTAIAGAVGIPVSSTAAICNALEAERMIVRRNEGYVLGPLNVELAQRFLSQLQPLSAFADVVAEHKALRHETVQMALLDGFDVLYVARRDSDQPFLISSAVGKRLPANCTAVGKASLALLEPDQRRIPASLPSLTDKSLDDPEALTLAIEQAAERGYAVDDEETSPGVMCLGVARKTPRNEVYGISATLLKSRFTIRLRDAIVADLKATADELFPPPLQSA
jgi:IclR family transcriptional regulator, blcABC operon repressor